MNIQYLKKLQDNPEDKYSLKKIRGVSEEQITEYENQFGVTFPLVYKEFLFLAGSYSGYLYLLEGTSSIDDFAEEGHQKYFKEKFLDFFNFDETRPYWVFSKGSQAFWFFYLDEETEDPIVWQAEFYEEGSCELNHPGEKQTFSEFINDIVDGSIKYYKETYG